MKEYSYVDERGDFKGPHTFEELLQLKGLKVIGDPTQILDESSRRLTTLRELLSNRTGPVVFPVTPASAAAPATVASPTSRTNGVCIACGGRIPATSAQCPYCQMDTRRSDITGREIIQALEYRLSKIKGKVDEDGDEDEDDKKKAMVRAISMFNMPNDKENLLEFFSLCDGNVSANASLIDDGNGLHNAWYGKAKTAYIKLKVYARDDAAFLALLAPYGQRYEDDAYLKSRGTKSFLLYAAIVAAIVIMVVVFVLLDKFSK